MRCMFLGKLIIKLSLLKIGINFFGVLEHIHGDICMIIYGFDQCDHAIITCKLIIDLKLGIFEIAYSNNSITSTIF